jgi:uncharacterized protein (DUF1697 family)
VTRLRTYVALLRGVNVGKTTLAMADLRALVDGLGYEDVTTYVQSGNVVFRSSATAAEVTEAVERRLRSDHDLSVKVLVRTSGQLAKVVDGNPFLADGRDPAKLHVTFLTETPDRARVRELDPTFGEPDEFRIVREVVYLHCPNGYGRTKLNNAFLERKLGVAATTRNWKTVTKLAELASA